MINKELLKMIQGGTVFVNTSRVGVIDEPAMIEALKKQRFTEVLDVYEQEPMAPDNTLHNITHR
jgi:phosphoglycerate dehydrogenase-like enzyme